MDEYSLQETLMSACEGGYIVKIYHEKTGVKLNVRNDGLGIIKIVPYEKLNQIVFNSEHLLCLEIIGAIKELEKAKKGDSHGTRMLA